MVAYHYKMVTSLHNVLHPWTCVWKMSKEISFKRGNFLKFPLLYSKKIKCNPKVTFWWTGMDSNHRTRMRTDLQSAAFSHSATYPYINKNWCSLKDSNLGPTGYEPVALTNWAKGAFPKREINYKIFFDTCQYFFVKKWKRKTTFQNSSLFIAAHLCITFGRGRRIRTLTGGFGDRCATIDTIPLLENTSLYYHKFMEYARGIVYSF